MGSIVKCLKCRNILDEPNDLERKPCSKCGSLSRSFDEEIELGVYAHYGLALKQKHGKSKPFYEEKVVNEFRRDSGKLVRRKMVIDRENDWYEEEVTHIDTKEIIYKCAEPLSKHLGHGAAKQKKREEI